jgi:hypothetical protein
MHRMVPMALLLFACASPPPPHPFDDLIGRADVVTLTNLHPDEARSRLFATNYQQAGLIPVCSGVELLERDAKRLRFRQRETGKVYDYFFHEAAGEPFPEHLARVFGSACPRAALEALPELDRRGLTLGKPLVGMSREGVWFALGHPPRHVTPSLESNRWIYWTYRFNRIAIVFDDGGHVLVVED